MLGCMAERLKVKLLDSDKLVDLVAGPDAYRDIPRLLDTIEADSALFVMLIAAWSRNSVVMSNSNEGQQQAVPRFIDSWHSAVLFGQCCVAIYRGVPARADANMRVP